MKTLEILYVKIAVNMEKVAIGFIALVIGLTLFVRASVIEDHLLLAWGLVALFSLFLCLGDYVTGWFDKIADRF